MNNKKVITFVVWLTAIISLSSCYNDKAITYFQKTATEKDTISVISAYVPKIQPGDILSIFVNSLSTEASSFFNPYSQATTAPSTTGDASGGSSLSQASAPGFLVDADGNINLPLIGIVKISGLTTSAASDTIAKRLTIYLKEPTVSVRFLNYKISILGEVIKPGVYTIPNERITIPEALTLAGDVTPFAKRSDIMIIRDVDTKKEFADIDLTNRSVFSSPYYYLRANDIIYVKAIKNKASQTDLTLRILPLAISFVTLIVLIATKL